MRGGQLAPAAALMYQAWLFPLMVAARVAERGRRAPRDGPPVRPLPGPVNGTLRRIFESEKHLLGRVPLPIGGSLISVHRRRA